MSDGPTGDDPSAPANPGMPGSDAPSAHDVGAAGDHAVDGPAETVSDVTTEDGRATEDARVIPADAADAGDVVTDVTTEAAAPADGCAGPEVCTNGIDDDCNGFTDCADPACAAYTCAAAVPSGWLGPITLWQASNPATPPACLTSYGSPVDATSGLNAPAASCGPCTCTASGQTCSAIMAYVDSDTNCSTACSSVSASSGVCTDLPNCGGASFSMMLPEPTVTGGSCMANAGSVTVPPATWDNSARLCSYAGPTDSPGGCPSAGDQCVLSPTSGFGTTPCVYSTAAPPPNSCPAPYNATGPNVFYSGETDTRGCAGCTCASGGPSGGSCSGTITIFGASGCAGATANYTLGSGCNKTLSVSPQPASVRGSFTVSTAGTCSVQTPPTPRGAATATGPLTVCCM